VSQYVVAELPQSFDGWFGKVLISEEAGQRLGLLILSDLTVDLVEVTSDKRPGVDQVCRSECGECAQDLGFSQTGPPAVLQRPDRDSCSRDPRITTTSSECLLTHVIGSTLKHAPSWSVTSASATSST